MVRWCACVNLCLHSLYVQQEHGGRERENAETLDSHKRARQHFCASASPELMCKHTLGEVQNNVRKVKNSRSTQTNLHLLSLARHGSHIKRAEEESIQMLLSFALAKSASVLTPSAAPRLLTMEG